MVLKYENLQDVILLDYSISDPIVTGIPER